MDTCQQTATVPGIESNGTRLFLIDLTFDSRAAVPGRLLHHLSLLPQPDRYSAHTMSPQRLISEFKFRGQNGIYSGILQI